MRSTLAPAGMYLIAILIVAPLVPLPSSGAGPARPVTPAPTGPAAEAREQRLKIAKLQKQVLMDDGAPAKAALKELQGMGAPAKAAIADAMRQLLARDKAKADAAARTAGDAATAKALETQLAAARQQAADNLAKLDRGAPLQLARTNYDKLNALYAKLQPIYTSRATIADVQARRPELKATLEGSLPASGTKPPTTRDAAEAQLEAAVEKAWGVPASKVAEAWAAGDVEPQDAGLRGGWLYGFCRRTEAYDKSLLTAGAVDPVELELARQVNHYRELLGFRPLELDARLAQAARRHAKEMVDLKYFKHESPTDGLHSPKERIEAAGYSKEAGGEALATGPTPEAAFWGLFNDPDNHRLLVASASSAAGSGKWNDKWVVTFGAAPRLMLASDADRQNASPRGSELPPQSAGTASARRPNNNGHTPAGQQQPDDPRLPKPRLPGGGGVPSVPSLPGLGL